MKKLGLHKQKPTNTEILYFLLISYFAFSFRGQQGFPVITDNAVYSFYFMFQEPVEIVHGDTEFRVCQVGFRQGSTAYIYIYETTYRFCWSGKSDRYTVISSSKRLM
jgi:hypothetical protein